MVAARLVPLARVAAGPTLCPLHRVTGRPCPTCGMTRSVVAAAHGELRAAVGFHAFGPALLVGLAGLAAGLGPVADRRIPDRVRRALAVVGAVTWTVYVIDRARRVRPVVSRRFGGGA